MQKQPNIMTAKKIKMTKINSCWREMLPIAINLVYGEIVNSLINIQTLSFNDTIRSVWEQASRKITLTEGNVIKGRVKVSLIATWSK